MTGEKTEQPTEKKLDDSRKEGQVPQRKNVLEAFIITGGVLMVGSLWPTVGGHLAETLDSAFTGISDGFDGAVGPALAAGFAAIRLVIVMSLVLGVALLLFNLLLNKFNFAPGALKPKFEKLNPITGLKGIFSKNTLYNFGRLMVYFPVVSLITYLLIRGNIRNVLNAASCGLTCLAEVFPGLLLQLVVLVIMVLILLAAMDYKLQTMIFISQNKMSKDDVKRETKGMQGDPQIKGKRQQISREDMQLPSPREVTHVIYSNAYLVALLYEEGTTPFIVMKAKGDAVPQIQARFKRMGVRCVNLPAVAKQFHMRYDVASYTDAKAAVGMAKVLKASGQM